MATYSDYQRFSQALRRRQFKEDVDGPICRWIYTKDGSRIKLDVMPNDEKILGFSNRWYVETIKNAIEVSLLSGKTIKVVSPVYFIATKLEAFKGRSGGDYYSHDMEDIVFVLENRRDIVKELLSGSESLKRYLAEEARLLLNDKFLNVLPGLLNSPGSAKSVEGYLRIMSSWT